MRSSRGSTSLQLRRRMPYFSLTVIALLLLTFVVSISALYEDQIGQFDWHQAHVGHVHHAAFHSLSQQSPPRLLLASSHSVLASLDPSSAFSSSSFAWRTKLEAGEVITASLTTSSSLIAVAAPSGITRAFSLSTGGLLWESGSHRTQGKPSLREELEVKSKGGDYADSVQGIVSRVLLLPTAAEAGAGKGRTADGRVVVQYADQVRVYSVADGEEEWRWSGDGQAGQPAQRVLGVTVTDGAVHVVAAADGSAGGSRLLITSFAADSGAVQITSHIDIASSASVNGSHVHVSRDGFVAALQSSGGSIDVVNLRTAGRHDRQSFSIASLLPAAYREESSFFLNSESESFPSAFLLSSPSSHHLLSFSPSTPSLQHSKSLPGQFRVFGPGSSSSASPLHYAAVHVNFPPNPSEVVVNVYSLDSDQPVFSVHRKDWQHGQVERAWLTVEPAVTGRGAAGAGGSAVVSRVLLVSADWTASYVEGALWLWDREEALAGITELHWTELPSDSDIHVSGHAYPSVFERIGLQVKGAMKWVHELIRTDWLAHFTQQKSLVAVRQHTGPLFIDEFGLRKLVVAATASGRVIAFESEHGGVVWSKQVVPAGSSSRVWRLAVVSPSLLLVVTRDADGFALQEVDSMSGDYIGDSRRVAPQLDSLILTPYRTDSGQRIALLTHADTVYAHPHTAEALSLLQPHLRSLYYHCVDLANDSITGYALAPYSAVPSSLSSLRAVQVWQLAFPSEVETIAALAPADPFRTVQSAVRMVGGGEGGLLYKYLNPNLLLVATERSDVSGRPLVASVKRSTDPSVSVYLLDTVSGAVYEHWVHRGAVGPVHAVQSENLLCYALYSTVTLQHEISVVELYEPRDAEHLSLLHAVQSVGASASSLSSYTEPPPFAIQQAFVFRSAVKGLTVSHTLRGITSMEVVALLPTDQLLSISRHLLDPRRPTAAEPSALDKAEGLIPYSGELPFSPQQVVNYNRSVVHLRAASTSPALLESTSLICGWGVDVWCGRLTPSATFDLLNEDFNYPALIFTVTAVLAAILVTGRWARQKELQLAWK